MNTSENNFDAIETLIFEENLRIEAIRFDVDADLLYIYLNTKAILKQKISEYPALKNCSHSALQNFILIACGTGVHWADLNEDLSLKGFLENEIRHMVRRPAA